MDDQNEHTSIISAIVGNVKRLGILRAEAIDKHLKIGLKNEKLKENDDRNESF